MIGGEWMGGLLYRARSNVQRLSTSIWLLELGGKRWSWQREIRRLRSGKGNGTRGIDG
jgi:hypothetical protein